MKDQLMLLLHKRKEKLQRRLKSQSYKSTKTKQAKILTSKKSNYKIRKRIHNQNNQSNKNSQKNQKLQRKSKDKDRTDLKNNLAKLNKKDPLIINKDLTINNLNIQFQSTSAFVNILDKSLIMCLFKTVSIRE